MNDNDGRARGIAQEALRLHRAGQVDRAIPLYRQALAIDPSLSFVYTSLGVALRAQGNNDAAIACYWRALELDPDNGVTYSNMGNALRQAGRIDEAVRCQMRAVELNGDDPEAHYNCGVALKSAGRLRDSLERFEQACRLKPDHVEAQWDRSLVLLHLGDYDRGWPAYEWRWRRESHPPPKLTQPRWDGSPFSGKSLLLYSEQGFGDVIQFVRFVPQVKALGGRVIVECKPVLSRLLQSVHGIDEIVLRGAPLPQFDLQCPLLSVPGLLRTTLETLPDRFPYLAPPPGIDAKFAPLLARAGNRLKVGIVWSGSVTFQGNHLRATTLSRFLDLLRVPDIHLFSLQMGPPRRELEELDLDLLLTDLTPSIEDFADTAAVLQQLDLVIMTDSSVAHLAGALDRPIWNILCHVPDWRWLEDRRDSPWYPSMRLFRQTAYDRWDEVFEEVIGALAERVRSRKPPSDVSSADEVVLPSAFTNERGEPRFEMPIPRAYLKDPGIAYLWNHETSFGGYEFPTRKFFDEHLAPGDVFVDVGAHWGVYSLSAATRFPGQVEVLAVEAHPDNAKRLRRWVEHNRLEDQIEVVAAAVGAAEGSAALEHNSTMGFRVIEQVAETGVAGESSPSQTVDTAERSPMRVPLTTLDRLLAERPRWSDRRVWIKIDVEGLEPDVVEGAASLLDSGRVAAVVWEKGRNFLLSPHHERMVRMVQALQERGFRLYRFPHEGLGGPLIPFIDNRDLCNVFALSGGLDKKDVYDKPFGPIPPVFRPNLPPLTAEQRIEQTRRLIEAKSSDAARWLDPEELRSNADGRAELASRFIPAGARVLDLGSGLSGLRAFLAGSGSYTPVDLVQRSEDCLVADFNQRQFPSGRYDYSVVLELLEYLHDPAWLARRAADCSSNLLLFYHPMQDDSVERRRALGWFNDLSHDQMLDLLRQCGWSAEHVVPSFGGLLYVCRRADAAGPATASHG